MASPEELSWAESFTGMKLAVMNKLGIGGGASDAGATPAASGEGSTAQAGASQSVAAGAGQSTQAPAAEVAEQQTPRPEASDQKPEPAAPVAPPKDDPSKIAAQTRQLFASLIKAGDALRATAGEVKGWAHVAEQSCPTEANAATAAMDAVVSAMTELRMGRLGEAESTGGVGNEDDVARAVQAAWPPVNAVLKGGACEALIAAVKRSKGAVSKSVTASATAAGVDPEPKLRGLAGTLRGQAQSFMSLASQAVKSLKALHESRKKAAATGT